MMDELLKKRAAEMKAAKAAKAAAAAAAAAAAKPACMPSDDDRSPSSSDSESDESSDADTLPPPPDEALVFFDMASEAPSLAHPQASVGESAESDAETVEPSPDDFGGDVPFESEPQSTEPQESPPECAAYHPRRERYPVAQVAKAREGVACDDVDAVDALPTAKRRRGGPVLANDKARKPRAAAKSKLNQGRKRTPSGFQGDSESEDGERRREHCLSLAEKSFVAPEDVEIVCMDSGIDYRESRMADEKEEHLKQWGPLLYPRIHEGYVEFHNLKARELQLSSKPEDQRYAAPIGILPERVVRFLSLYQCDGIKFLYRLFERGRGGLLADAMGLGKTIMMVAFLGAACGVWSRDPETKPKSARILVCVPKSVVEAWKRAFDDWTPFRVREYSTAEGPGIRAEIKTDDVDVVIVTDSILRLDMTGKKDVPRKPFFDMVKWHIFVIDEVHVAKNVKTATNRAMSAINARLKYGLTGTAMQNRLLDIHAIIEMLVAGSAYCPDRAAFIRLYRKPIEAGRLKNASPLAVKNGELALRKLRRWLCKQMIRRSKAVISERIPGKTDCGAIIKMMPGTLQMLMWVRFINSYDCYMIREAGRECDCGSGSKSAKCCHSYPSSEDELRRSPVWKSTHRDGTPCESCPRCICFSLMHVGLSISCHALLLLPDLDEERNVPKKVYERRLALMKYYTDDMIDEKTALQKLEIEGGMSCKLDTARALIDSFNRGGHKTIIFYQSLRLGKILMRWATYIGYKFKHIDGSTKKSERQKRVDEFQRESLYTLFFVSKQAGGTGLNITAADRVLIFEPHWNPSQDLQSQDRAHRLGQKKVVKVFRLIVQGSVEEYQLKTQLSKIKLSNIVLDGTSEQAFFSKGEIGNMAAMLKIDERFMDGAGASYDATVAGKVSFEVHEKLDFEREPPPEVAVGGESLFGGRNDCLMGMDKQYLEVDVDPEEVAEFGACEESADCSDAGGELLCSDDESEDPLEDPLEDPPLDEDEPLWRGQAAFPGNDDKIGSDSNCDVEEIDETQQVDMLLLHQNADSRVMISSNEPKNLDRKQLLKQPNKESGGVNCGRGDVNRVNLDDSPRSSDDESPLGNKAEFERPSVDTKADRNARLLSNLKADAGAERDAREESGAKQESARCKAVMCTNTEEGGLLKRSRVKAEHHRGSEACVAGKNERGVKRAKRRRVSDISDSSDDDVVRETPAEKKKPSKVAGRVKERPVAVSKQAKSATTKPRPKAAAKAKKAPAAKKGAFASRRKFV